MNANITSQTRQSTSLFAKRAACLVVLTAVTLPVAFAQNTSSTDSLKSGRREKEAAAKWRAKHVSEQPANLEGAALLDVLARVAKMPAAQLGKSAPAKAAGSTLAAGVVSPRIDLGNVNNKKWVTIGPFGSRVGQRGGLGETASIVGGRVNAVAYDSKNPTIIYVATAGGGLWRYNPADTIDAAPSYPWRPLGDKFGSLATYAVTVSPFNSKVVLVGTGAGIQRSINGGNTFVAVGTGLGKVTRILVDPENANTLYATHVTSRYNSGIAVSTDLGNTWTDIDPTTPTDIGAVIPDTPHEIGEEWNDLEISLPDDTGSRFMYATSRRAGLYRSPNRGATWEHVNAPLIYNPLSLAHIDPYAGGYGMEVAVSATDPYTLYVMDSNEAFDDGKIFVSKNAGDTWTEVSGNYPVDEGGSNNWSLATTSFGALAIPTFLPGDTGELIAVDALLGGTRQTYSTEFSATQSALYSGRDWSPVATTHIDQHDYSYVASNPNRALVANDGGIYELTYDPSVQSWTFSNNSLNRNLVAMEFYSTSFHPSQLGFVLGGTINNGLMRSQGSINNWAQIQGLNAPFSSNALVGELPAGTTGGQPSEAVAPGMYVGSVAYDPSVANGSVQYSMDHANSGQRIYVTTNNWGNAWEITPSRTIHNSNGIALQVNGADLFAFPQVNTQSSTIATNWSGETRRPQGILVPDRFGGNRLYSGGNYLWRYDLLPGFAQQVNPVNVDRGTWRRVGTTNLAPEAGDYITAIAVAGGGQRVYVGTHLGKLWMTRFALQQDATTPIPNLTGPWIELDNPTLPSRIDPPAPTPPIRREITAISVNPNNPSSDILVGIVDAGLYRCANTLGTNFLFTNQNGSGINGLPGSNISTILRDTVTSGTGDADNSWFVGTATGVYSTNNQGTSWSDATVPLGLPQVPITSMDLNTVTGYLSVGTAGRGAWRFDLRGAVEQVALPVLNIKYALSRNAGVLYGNVTVENTGGQAKNVAVSLAELTTERGANTQANSINPSSLGTIGTGAGSSRSTTITWPGTAGKLGEVVTLHIRVTASNGGPFDLSVRTRLP